MIKYFKAIFVLGCVLSTELSQSRPDICLFNPYLIKISRYLVVWDLNQLPLKSLGISITCHCLDISPYTLLTCSRKEYVATGGVDPGNSCSVWHIPSARVVTCLRIVCTLLILQAGIIPSKQEGIPSLQEREVYGR